MSSSKRALVAIAVLVCAAAAGVALLLYRMHRPLPEASAGKTPDIFSQLPADAPIIAYVDVTVLKKLQGSPLAAMLGLAGEDPRQDTDYKNFVRGTGFDYTRDLDRAAIAFWPESTPKNSRGGDENRSLAIADGRFDEAKIKAYALGSGRAIASGNQTHYIVPGNPPIALEFLSPRRIRLASGPDAANLLSAPNSATRDPAMQERINRVAGAPMFAVARTDRMPASYYDSLRNVPQFRDLARSVEGLALAGRPDGDLIHLTLDAECDSMKNAFELATVVDGLRVLGSMALADPNNRGQMTRQQAAFLTALLHQAKLTRQDRWVRLTLDVTPAMLGEGSASTRGFDAAEPVYDARWR